MKPVEVLDIPLEGTRLIEASAGTGKTFTIALLYVRLVMERGFRADQILVVTYTRAAAAELRDRIRKRLQEAAHTLATRLVTGEHGPRPKHSKLHEIVEASIGRGSPEAELERLRDALRGFDEAAISTIHGFCERVLDENAFESGVSFDTELVADQRALVDDVVADFWTRSLYAAEPEFVSWLRATTSAGEKIRPGLLTALAEAVAQQPRVVVLPESAPDTDAADLEGRAVALARVRELWENGGPAVLERLADAAAQGILNKRRFDPAKLCERFTSEIEEFLDHPVVGSTHGKQGAKKGLSRIDREWIEKSTNKGKTSPVDPLFEAAGELVRADTQCGEVYAARWIGLQLDLIATMRRELARRRQASRTRSFDELLSVLADALEGPGGPELASRIRTRFPAALIDEFQDTDPVQYAIFRNVWHEGETPFFLIGDPKQAIYAFRGADVFAYMQAKSDAGPDAIGLDCNWRSDPSVVEGVNTLFRRVGTPFLFDAIPFHPAHPAPDAVERLDTGEAGAGLRILLAAREGSDDAPIGKGHARTRISAAVAEEIAELIDAGARIDDRELVASDIAVLCATHADAARMREQLGRCGVASVMQTRQSVFETDEAAALERILAAAAEPTHAGRLRAAITTTWVGVDATALRAIDADPDGLDPWFEVAADWHTRLRSAGMLALVESILHEHGSRERLLADAGGERRLTNLFHLAELMQTSAGASTSPRALLRWLERMRRDAAARAEDAGDDALIRLESDAKAVQIVTIHSSKGLQYGVVYCPFLWDARGLSPRDREWVKFHDPDAAHRLTLDLGSAGHDEALQHAKFESFAEASRLLYVALTRAIHRVVLVWGPINGAGGSALGSLLHPLPDHAQRIAARDGELAKACQDRFKALSDEELQAELETLVAASKGSVAVVPMREASRTRRLRAGSRDVLHDARILPRRIVRRRQVSSFSRLVADFGPGSGFSRDLGVRSSDEHPAAAGRDYDAASVAALADPGALAPSTGADGVAGARVVPLHAFPAGAGPGTLIHHVFEHLDFSDRSPAALDTVVHEALARFGMSESLAPSLAAGLRAALDAPLGGTLAGFSLRGLERRARIDEMEFTLPVALAGAERLSPARLADAFARHAESPTVRAYAERVRRLGFPELAGHLRGFIDLVFRHDGRFHLVDYKSNQLGPTFDRYAPGILDAVMPEHDYTLQYHLYTLALHRFLSTRLPGYSYAEHFGGVHYLFVRGMSPQAPIGQGVFHDRPPEALVEALSQALGDVDPRAFREQGP